ncbi:MAG: FAD-dependent oxidoreductase [Micromonospora sp.]
MDRGHRVSRRRRGELGRAGGIRVGFGQWQRGDPCRALHSTGGGRRTGRRLGPRQVRPPAAARRGQPGAGGSVRHGTAGRSVGRVDRCPVVPGRWCVRAAEDDQPGRVPGADSRTGAPRAADGRQRPGVGQLRDRGPGQRGRCRHILGEHVLTGEEIMRGTKVEDVVSRGYFPIDIHNLKGKEGYGEGSDVGTWHDLDDSYDVPYRCLVPRRLDGLVIAGRAISATHEAHGSFRTQGGVMGIGQAAGTAAAIAAIDGAEPRKVDVSRLQEALVAQKASLRRDPELVSQSSARPPSTRSAGPWLKGGSPRSTWPTPVPSQVPHRGSDRDSRSPVTAHRRNRGPEDGLAHPARGGAVANVALMSCFKFWNLSPGR